MTKHSYNCKMAFGHKDLTCPRCRELLAGSAPRDGWQKSYYAYKALDTAMTQRAMDEHFALGGPHELGKCGPVCTAFDW